MARVGVDVGGHPILVAMIDLAPPAGNRAAA